MCMATVWFKKDKKEQEILKDVAEIKKGENTPNVR